MQGLLSKENRMNENEIKILIVDDEPDVIEILKYNLTRKNFIVFTASNGNEAIVIAEKESPDLVILDIRMPGISGIETCRKMRQIESLKNTPVLFLTADSDEYTALNAIDAGGNHFITKPIRPSILLNMIGELIKKTA